MKKKVLSLLVVAVVSVGIAAGLPRHNLEVFNCSPGVIYFTFDDEPRQHVYRVQPGESWLVRPLDSGQVYFGANTNFNHDVCYAGGSAQRLFIFNGDDY